MSLARTNVELNLARLARAKAISGLHTTKAVIDFALARLDSTSKGLEALMKLKGRVHFRKGYSYKKSRG